MLIRLLLFGFAIFVVYSAFKLGKIVGKIPSSTKPKKKKKRTQNIEEAEYEDL